MAEKTEVQQKSVVGDKPQTTEDEIRKRAYEIYCARNGAPGDELSDWLKAGAQLREGSRIFLIGLATGRTGCLIAGCRWLGGGPPRLCAEALSDNPVLDSKAGQFSDHANPEHVHNAVLVKPRSGSIAASQSFFQGGIEPWEH